MWTGPHVNSQVPLESKGLVVSFNSWHLLLTETSRLQLLWLSSHIGLPSIWPPLPCPSWGINYILKPWQQRIGSESTPTERCQLITQTHLHFEMEIIRMSGWWSLESVCWLCPPTTCRINEKFVPLRICTFGNNLYDVWQTQRSKAVHDCNSRQQPTLPDNLFVRRITTG